MHALGALTSIAAMPQNILAESLQHQGEAMSD
jgi:hypothetical protein